MTLKYLRSGLVVLTSSLVCLGAHCQSVGASSADPIGTTQQPTLLSDPRPASDATRDYLHRADSLERDGHNVEAEMLCRSALAHFPASLELTVHLAGLLQREHEPAASITYWKRASELRPDLSNLRSSLAASYLEAGDNEAALQILRPLVKEQPTSGNDLLNLGAALARTERFAEAVEVYKEATLLPEIQAEAQLLLVKALITLSRFDEALPLAEQYRDAHQGTSEAHALLGRIYFRETGHMKEAEQELRSAVSSNPDDRDSQYYLGVICRQNGNMDEAVDHLKSAVALKPDATDAHFQLAGVYRSLKMPQLAAAEAAMLHSIETKQASETEVAALESKARQAFEAGDYNQALALYNDLQPRTTKHTEVSYNLALVYERLGNRHRERDVLEQAVLDDSPASSPLHNQLGFLDLAEGRALDAKQEFDKALRKDPQNVEALGNLAVMSAKAGELDTATRNLMLAVDIDPAYEKGYLNLGLILASQGAYSQALLMARKAASLTPTDRVASTLVQQLSNPQMAGAVHTNN